MRLFQAQPVYGENSSPPPPPPFSVEREATRVMPIYLSHFRDGRHRLPTPEKIAVMELSHSFERRRLGKHQQILTDISQRCREQEISDLSSKLSSKVNLKQADKQDANIYSSYFMRIRKRRNSISNQEPTSNSNHQSSGNDVIDSNESSKTIYEQNYKQFPARRIMRQNSKFDFLKPQSGTPRVLHHIPKSSSSDSMLSLRARLAHRQQINGPIQLDHYTTPRPDLAPLVLSNERFFQTVQTERLDRSDTYFSTSRVVLGPRGKSSLNFNNPADSTSGKQTVLPKPIAPVNLNSYGREMSSLQITSGHSPPPNSVQEVQ